MPVFYVMPLAINANDAIFAAVGDGGVYRSTDNGDTWTIVDAGLTTRVVGCVSIDADGFVYRG